MKLTIENHSRHDIADVSQIVTDLLRREREFMLANTVRGCQFKIANAIIAMYPVCKDYPAGEMAFIVADADEKKGRNHENG